MLFDVCDLDFDLMPLVLKLGLDIMVTYWYIKNWVNRLFGSKFHGFLESGISQRKFTEWLRKSPLNLAKFIFYNY